MKNVIATLLLLLFLGALGLGAGPACLSEQSGEEESAIDEEIEDRQELEQTLNNSLAASFSASSPAPCTVVSDPGGIFSGGRVVFDPSGGSYIFESSSFFPGYRSNATVDCGRGLVYNPPITRTATAADLNAYFNSICSQPAYSWGMASPNCSNTNTAQTEEYWSCSYSCSGTIYVHRRNPEWPNKTTPIFEQHPAFGSASAEAADKWACCGSAQTSAHGQISGQVSAHWARPEVQNVFPFDYGLYCAGQYLNCGATAVKKTRIRY